MTKLEEEIMEAMARAPKVPVYDVFNSVREFQEEMTLNAKAAADVAKKYIGMAFHQNPALRVQELCGMTTENKLWQEFAKENGITE